MSQPGDRLADIVLQGAEHRVALIGAGSTANRRQAESNRGHHLDRVVVNVGGDALAFLLLRLDDVR
jgi:hypothetical protein